MRPRVHVSNFYGTGSPAQRLEQLHAARADEQAFLRTAANPLERDAAERNIERLDGWIADTEGTIAHIAGGDQARTEAAARQRAEREQTAEDALRAELHSAFMAGNPGAAESDFETAWPRLKERHQIQRMDRLMDRARSSGVYRL